MIVILIIVLLGKDCHNGWFTGYVTWFNSTMKKVRVAYEDDIDEVEIDN